jgi:ATP-binding cassette subfamily F protein 3
MLLLKKFSLATAQEGVLLQNCDAILGENHRVGLVGRNGCGKSTFLSCLSNAGADADSHFDVTSGEVAFGKSVSREHVLLVRQDKLKWSDLFTEVESEEIATQSTIQELLDLEMHDTAAEEDEEWRRLVLERGWGGLDVPIAELSPGSALRAFIALSLIRVNIKVLLLDEVLGSVGCCFPLFMFLSQRLQIIWTWKQFYGLKEHSKSQERP